MLIKLIRGCIVPGFPAIKPGDVVDVPSDIAQDLLAIRKAERVVDAPAKLEVRDPVVESRDEKPVKRSKSKVV